MKDKSLFSDTCTPRKLCNVFVDSPPELLDASIEDLLSMSKIGQTRMFSYIRQYALEPPTELQQKRRRQKLKTFTKNKDTSKKLNTKLNQATLLLSSAYKSLLNPGSGCKQTFPLPLAICTPDGTMRKCNKSIFRDVILDIFPGSHVVATQCPFITSTPVPHELIVDFLFILHQPPPPDVDTFASYASYIWDKIIFKLGVCRGANIVRIIVDKSTFFPEPRALLHDTRSSNTGKMNAHECTICDEGLIPLCNDYQKMLANAELKRKYISYLMDYFVKTATNNSTQIQLILDHEDLSCPCLVSAGNVLSLPILKNRNGEADYNVWFHCMMSTSEKIVVLGSDTDIWVYGMMFLECGWLQNKTVYVECKIGKEYVHLNKLMDMAHAHPKLKTIPFPLTSLAVVYILTGGDYISSFFRSSKKTFTTAFIENIQYICSDGFVDMESYEAMGIEGYILTKLLFDGWVKLSCCVYLLKHKTLFNSERISSLHASLMASTLQDDKVQLMKWLAYTQVHPLQNLSQWHDFTRRVCFHHSSGSKDHECLLIPSMSALRLHMLRSEYVFKIVFNSLNSTASVVNACEYGWKATNNQIFIVWDEEEVMNRLKVGKGCGCKAAKCDGSGAGCRNCFQMCRPCSMKCKCKLRCRNPHNNGGTCERCRPTDLLDVDSDIDVENEGISDSMLPLVERRRESVDTNTDDTDVE